MAGGKRVGGADAAFVAFYCGFGGCTPTYEQFVSVWLNLEDRIAADNFHNAVTQVVAGGDPIPDQWIAAALSNPAEASKWRRWDLRRTTKS